MINTNEKQKHPKQLPKKENSNKTIFTASKGFASKQYYKALDEIYKRIREDNKQLTDFDDDDFLRDIMKSLNVE